MVETHFFNPEQEIVNTQAVIDSMEFVLRQNNSGTYSDAISDTIGWALSSREPERHMIEKKAILKVFFTKFGQIMDNFADNLSIQEDAENKKDNATRKESNTAWAQFNQMLAHDLFLASQLPFNHPLRKSVVSFSNIVTGLAEGMGKAGMHLEALLKGARAQSAIFQTALSEGHYVMVPNTKDEEEVYRWDVLAGADLVIINQDGVIFLVDARGKQNIHHKELQTSETYYINDLFPIHYEVANEIGSYLRQQLLNSNLSNIHVDRANKVVNQLKNSTIIPQRVQVVLPTAPQHLSLFGEVLNPFISRSILKAFQISR